MTATEIKKLEAIIGKIETLQNSTKNRTAKDRLGVAKTELLRILRG